MNEFSSSFLFGGDLILNQYITIDGKNLTFEKEKTIFGITSSEVVIPIKYIRKIETDKNIFGCNIRIYYCYPFKNYEEMVIARGFSYDDVEQIKELIL
jgi:hypothetical protein